MSDDRYRMLLRIPPDMANEMLAEAKRNGIGRTAMVTTLMREALDARAARRRRLESLESVGYDTTTLAGSTHY